MFFLFLFVFVVVHLDLPDNGPRLQLLANNDVDFIGANQNRNRNQSPATDSALAALLQAQRTSPIIQPRDGTTTATPPRASGALVRCTSAHSAPAPTLHVLVNNRLVDNSARVVQNATLSYSNGLEAAVATVRLTLSDFGILENNNNKEDVETSEKEQTINSGASLAMRLARNKIQARVSNSSVQFDDETNDKLPTRTFSKDNSSKRRKLRGDRKSAASRQTDFRSSPDSSVLNAHAQTTATSGTNANADIITNAANTLQVSASFVKVKCTSLVAAVGYEMSSELAVPLAVLLSSNDGSQFEPGSAPTGRRLTSGAGGSLQTPIQVAVERVAQASNPMPAQLQVARERRPLPNDKRRAKGEFENVQQQVNCI